MSDFAALGLSQQVLDAIQAMGFETPTPIQAKAIPELLKDDTDLVGLAQTGTGKTAAFGLPLIDLVDTNIRDTQALILAPTRELCVQISKELSSFAKNNRKLKILPVYGGTDIRKQMRELKDGVQIVTATPGRLRDLIKRRAIKLDTIEYVVLDEADEMLNMGFKEEIDEILAETPDDKLTWLFSATMPREVRRIAQQYMTDPLELSVGERNSTNVDIAHQYVIVRPQVRYEALKRFLDYDSDSFALVFTRTRRDSQEVAENLGRDGYNADALHGDMNQGQRDRVMARFRERRLQVLVATDVAARGIDVSEITHVFHYNIPEDRSFYTHRAGRTGRAGKKGISLVLAHPNDVGLLRQIERITKTKFEMVRIPTGKEICEKRLLSQMRRIKEVPVLEDVKIFLPAIAEELEGLDKEELISRVASLSFSRYFKAYRHAPDLNPRERGARRHSEGNTKFTRFFINVGAMDVDGKGGLLALVCGHANIPGSVVGRIDVNRTFTFFDVEDSVSKEVLNSFRDSWFEGRKLRVNLDSEGGGKPGKGKGGRRGFNKKRSFSKRR